MMKMTTYRELQVRNEILPLMDQAFEWPFNPVEFEETIKADPNYNTAQSVRRHGKWHLAGFVGVMDPKTRTLDGPA